MSPCKCTWEVRGVALLVTFDSGRTLLIQGSDDLDSFAANCGVDDPADATQCPDEYADLGD